MNRLAPIVSLFLTWSFAAQATTPPVASEIVLEPEAASAVLLASELGTTWSAGLPFDETRGTVVQDDHVGTLEAGLVVGGFHARGETDKAVRQADFLLSLQGTDGGLANGAAVRGKNVRPDEDARTLAAQAAAIQGFLAAWEVSGDEKYRTAARKAYLFVQRDLWATKAGVYRGQEGARKTAYDPVLLGVTVGAFRDLAEAHDGDVRAEMLGRIDALWAGVEAAGDPTASVTIDTRN